MSRAGTWMLSLALALAAAAPGSAQQGEPQGDRPAQGSTDEAEPQVPAAEPPRGPAEARKRIQRQEQQRAQRAAPDVADEPDEEPAEGDEAEDGPHGGVSRELLERLRGEGPGVSSGGKNPELPAGTLRVRVVDGGGDGVADAEVNVGMLGQGGSRDRKAGRTNAQGTIELEGLATGSSSAYRVNVPYQGATYSSDPFRLPPDQGYEVAVRRLPTTRDAKNILITGQVELTLKDGRLQVMQQYDFMNLSDKAFVFPDSGEQIELPEGFTAFQTQDSMGDQLVEETDDGFRVLGSIPPGRARLMWAFHVPLDGNEVSFDYPVPWRAYRYLVAAEAAHGMKLDVNAITGGEGSLSFSPPREHEHEGRRLLVTQMQRRPSDPPLERVSVRIRGIPGPGPLRWVALGGMLVLVCAGLLLATRRGAGASRTGGEAHKRRKDELLDEAVEIERMHAAGEIGPTYRQRRMNEVLTELAELLRQESAERATKGGGTAPSTT